MPAIISAPRANLNKSYFTNRQDRYIHFTSQPSLAQYCFSFLQSVSTFSYQLLPTDSLKSSDGYTLKWPDHNTPPYDIQRKAEEALTEFQCSYLKSPAPAAGEDPDVLVFPIIQGGQFNIREEEQCSSLLFDHLSTHGVSTTFSPSINLTSGYFGLYKPYQNLILQSAIDCRVIAASPMVSPFFWHCIIL